MKKYILIISTIVFLSVSSCNKKSEDPQPIQQQQVKPEIGTWDCWFSNQQAYNSSNQFLYSNSGWLISMDLYSNGYYKVVTKTQTLNGIWQINGNTLYLDLDSYNITQLTSSALHFDKSYINSKGEYIKEEYMFNKR